MTEAARIIEVTPEVEKAASTEVTAFVSLLVKVVDNESLVLATTEVDRADRKLKDIEELIHCLFLILYPLVR